MNIFLAHSRSAADSELAEWSDAIRSWAAADGIQATVITGRDDFAANIAMEGSIDAWATGLPTRKDSFTREPFYGAIVVPGLTIGKATALIVESALKNQIPVFALERGEFCHIERLVVVNDQDFSAGWRLA